MPYACMLAYNYRCLILHYNIIQIESTVDSNGVPIMFEVNVKRSNSNNMTPKCSFKISAANSKCIANALLKYRCEINFTVSSCPQLQEQPQDADYQIGIFTENDIGKSSLNASNNIPCKLNF